MSGLTMYIVDAFSERPFAGNPAAVCLLDDDRSDDWMQATAAEMNLSETAYLLSNRGEWSLRWFTPTMEVDLCGHATLASAHVLWEAGVVDPNKPINFQTRSGPLTTTTREGWIDMDFPADPVVDSIAPDALAEALGVPFLYVGRSKFDYLVQLENEDAVRRLTPRMDVLGRVETRGVIVTAPTDGESYDFVSRFFAPRAGIDEDPVTGSAHCALGPYWGVKLHRKSLVGRQISRRGGVVRVEVKKTRVVLRGQAVTVLRGALLV